MTKLQQETGIAILWKSLQMVSTKVIFLVRTLVLTWLLTPDDFGLMSVSLVAIEFLLRLTQFGMIPALIQGKELKEEHYNTAWTVEIVRALGVAIVVIAAAPLLATLFKEPRAINLIRVLAFRPLLEAGVSIKVAKLTRQLDFRWLVLLRLSDGVVNTVLAIFLASSLGVWALIIGAMSGPLVRMVLSYVWAPHQPRLVFSINIIRPLIQFGRWIFVTSIIAMAGQSLLRVVISRELGTNELGLYFLAAKLAFIPMEITGEVIGTVAFPLYSRLQDDLPEMARFFRSFLMSLTLLILPMSTLLVALAPVLVEVILPDGWQGTASLIQTLALVNVLGLLGETALPILKGIGQPYRVVVLEIIQSMLLIGLVNWMIGHFGVLGAAATWLPAIVASQLLSAFYIARMLPKPFAGLLRPLLFIALISIFGGLLAVWLTTIITGLAGFIAATITSFVFMGFLLWLGDRYWHLGLIQNVMKLFPQLSVWLKFMQ